MTFLSVVGNILLSPAVNFTLHNKPTIELNNNSGTTLHLDCAQHQYVELPDTTIPCLQDLAACQKGFTFKLELQFTAMAASQKTYIVSNWDDLLSSGFDVYIQNDILIFDVDAGFGIRESRYKMAVRLNVWYTFEISWDKANGVSVLIYGKQVMIRDWMWAPFGTQSVLIGKASREGATSCMNIRELFAWTAPRDVLVRAGVLPVHSPSTTTSSTSTTTTTTTTTRAPPTPAPIPSYSWSLLNITNNVVVGVDYNLTVHGTQPVQFVGVHLNPSGSYVEITAHPDSCLLNPAACLPNGLTIQITMQFHKIEESTYIITSGGQTPDGVGLAILYRCGRVQFVLTTFNMSWYASVGREVLPAN